MSAQKEIQKNKVSVLLVGASGYIGSHLRLRLQNSFVVSTLTAQATPEEFLKSLILVRKTPDYIIICASKKKETEWVRSDLDSMASKVSYLLKIFPNAFYVYLSSVDVYGLPNNLPVNESTCTNPLSLYAESKLLIENELRSFLAENSFVCLRLPGVFGVNISSNSFFDKMISELRTTGGVTLRSKDVLGLQRDWIYLEDLTRIIERIITFRVSTTLNVVTGQSRSIKEWVGLAQSFVGKPARVFFKNPIKGERYYDLVFDNSLLIKSLGPIIFSSPSSWEFGVLKV